jgi:uncharacterized protein (DUF1015 family)
MMYLTGSGEKGLVIKPIHRALTRQMMSDVDLPQALDDLKEHFQVRESKVDLSNPLAPEKLLSLLTNPPRSRFVLFIPSGKVWTLDLREGVDPLDLVDAENMEDRIKRLDASILHHYIVSHVMIGNPDYELEEDDCTYVSDAGVLVGMVRERKAALGILMNPPALSDVIDVAMLGLRMPHRTTHFFPKPACGLVLRSMDSDERLKGKK